MTTLRKLSAEEDRWLFGTEIDQETITSTVDILALSVDYRHNTIEFQNTDFMSVLTDQTNFLPLSECSLQLAQKIRNYYRQKLTMMILKGGELSGYRKKMYQLVANNFLGEIARSDVGALIKLYEFYHEDQTMETLLAQTVSVDPQNYVIECNTDVYTFICSVNRVTRHIKQKRYFFKDSQDRLVWLQVEHKSQAIPVLDYMFKTGKKYKIESTANPFPVAGYNRDFFALNLGNNFNIVELIQ
jgi:hypothetical protein